MASADELHNRLESLQTALQETAATYDAREDGAEEGKRWGEVTAAFEDLSRQVGDVADELHDVQETYAAELGGTTA